MSGWQQPGNFEPATLLLPIHGFIPIVIPLTRQVKSVNRGANETEFIRKIRHCYVLCIYHQAHQCEMERMLKSGNHHIFRESHITQR